MTYPRIPPNLVAEYGPFWARNTDNLKKLRRIPGNSTGVYLLYYGWFPVYIGQGRLSAQIHGHARSHTKVWDRFTWLKLADSSRSVELEAIFLRSLPFSLRLHNKQGARLLVRSTKPVKGADKPDTFPMPKMLPKKRNRKNAVK
jgi:hypothetical protein